MAEQNPAPIPPDHRTVIARALCLASLAVRGTIESAVLLSPSSEDVETYKELGRRLSKWLNEQDFTGHFTIKELDALSKSAGGWTPSEHDGHESRVESLGVLSWSLSLEEKIPPYNQSFAMPDLEAHVGWPASALLNPAHPKLGAFPHNGADLLQGITQLRPIVAIKAERVSSDCWHWRTHVAALQRAKTPPPNGQPYEVMIAITAEEAHAASAIARPVRNDFSITGKSFASHSESDQLKIARIVSARRTALHWLSGYASEWDYVPVRGAITEPLAA